MRKQHMTEGVYIELRGKRRLVAEGIDALLAYDESCITVGAGADRITVTGAGLEMRYLSDARIVIEGEVQAIRYGEEVCDV